MNGPIAFTKIKLPYGWLGNMSPHRVSMWGDEWPTAEHAFQVGRFPEDHMLRTGKLHHIKSPMEAKQIVQHYRNDMVIMPTSDEDVGLMHDVLMAKLEYNDWMIDELLMTRGYRIIEDVTKRPHGNGLFWGAALQNGKWVGDNMLGQLWMSLRDEDWT